MLGKMHNAMYMPAVFRLSSHCALRTSRCCTRLSPRSILALNLACRFEVGSSGWAASGTARPFESEFEVGVAVPRIDRSMGAKVLYSL